MRRLGIKIFLAIAAASLLSCTEVIKPEEHIVPDETPAIEAFWASLDDLNRTDLILNFYMGKCFSYSCGGLHVVEDNMIWNCRRDDCLLKEIKKYAVEDGDLIIDGEIVGKVSFDDNGSAVMITIDEHEYTRFEFFTDDPHPTEEVSGVSLDEHSVKLIPGGGIHLLKTVYPEITFETKCTWQSTTPSVATVDNEGFVTALNPGETDIVVTTKVGGFTDSCHIIVNSDLSAAGTANCYIVPSSGWFSFDASVEGNSLFKIEGAVEAIILWSVGEQNAVPELDHSVSMCSYNPDTRRISFYATGENGNTVIALRDEDGKILWSWHIWASMNFEPSLTAQTYNNEAGVVMDRNLGALTVNYGAISTFGLSYQWGRKDPFPGSSSRTSAAYGSVGMMQSAVAEGYEWKTEKSVSDFDESIANPTVLYTPNTSNWYPGRYDLWTPALKTRHDPCPAGWHVLDGGPEGSIMKAIGGSATDLLLPNTALEYYRDAVNLGGIAGEDAVIWYQFVGRMANFKYESMGWKGYYWTNTLEPASEAEDADNPMAYCVYFYRNGGAKDARPHIYLDEKLKQFYACPVRCQKDVKK